MNIEEEINPMNTSHKRLDETTGAKEKVKVSFLRPPAGKNRLDGVLSRDELKR
mgnify:CR=1 FL=1